MQLCNSAATTTATKRQPNGGNNAKQQQSERIKANKDTRRTTHARGNPKKGVQGKTGREKGSIRQREREGRGLAVAVPATFASRLKHRQIGMFA